LLFNQKAHYLNVVGNKQVTKQTFFAVLVGFYDVKDTVYFQIMQIHSYHFPDVDMMI